MKKYQQLVKLYENEIEKIKSVKRRMNALIDVIKKTDNDINNSTLHGRVRLIDLYNQWGNINQEYTSLMADLMGEIEVEYHSVPFAAPRQQGYDKFFELAFGDDE